MKILLKKENLFLRVAIGFALGVLLGLTAKDFSIATKVVGDLYLNLIKLMIIPIVVCAVFCGIANIKDGNLLRRIGVRTVALYVVMFVVCAVISLVIAWVIRPGLGTVFENAPVYEGGGHHPHHLQLPDDHRAHQHHQGGSRRKHPAGDPLYHRLRHRHLVHRREGPPGAGLHEQPVRRLLQDAGLLHGALPHRRAVPHSLLRGPVRRGHFQRPGQVHRHLLAVLRGGISRGHGAARLPLHQGPPHEISPGLRQGGPGDPVHYVLRRRPATTINVSTQDLGAPEGVSKFTLPLGCTINMCGGACSFCCLAVFVSDFYSINLPLGTIVFLVLVATLLNMAAPGIPGGGVVLGASFLSILGLPIDLMGPISGFYRLLDMAFTTINVEGDVAANLMISKSIGEYDGSMAK